MKRIVLVLMFAVGCGGDSSGPLGPSVQTPTVSGLVISPNTNFFRQGATETYTATATMSNSTSQVVQATWTSDNSSLVSMSGSQATAIGNAGTTTIRASYQGATAARDVRVVPNYQGRWEGDYNVITCDASGDFTLLAFCTTLFPRGRTLPLTLTLTQDQDRIAGTLALGSITGSVSGPVSSDGHLNLEGTLTSISGGAILTITLGGWNTVADRDRMAGNWAMSFRGNISGNGYLEATIRVLVKTTANTAPTRSSENHFPTLEDLFRGFTTR